MSFSKQSKYISLVVGAVVLVVVLLLLLLEILSGSIIWINIPNLALEDLFICNTEQLFILLWEGFWITFGIVMIYKIVKLAKERQGESLVNKLENFEKYWVFGAVAGLTVLALITIPIAAPFLYGPHGANANATSVQNVDVTAQQFGFAINYVDDKGNSTHPLDADTFVRFTLSSIDVTHGFGLYTESGDIVIQVQIVPELPTEVTIQLAPGIYSIICMEYCGFSHHAMKAVNAIHVQ
ncbi:MAG: hypothetical protein ACW967_07035 [Candidatus Hodarchaeales archaeon]|jgi:cytochrome c oxidase subunit 2